MLRRVVLISNRGRVLLLVQVFPDAASTVSNVGKLLDSYATLPGGIIRCSCCFRVRYCDVAVFVLTQP